MQLTEALNLVPDGKGTMISFVGGGGKTSSLFALAYELAGAGKKVLVTTTTAMYNPVGACHPNITILGEYITTEGKLKGITKERTDEIYKLNSYDYILAEADGSRGRPIKAPAEHEPVIPRNTGILIGVIGMDAFGKELSAAYVHRPEILSELTGAGLWDRVNEEVIVKLVSHPLGLFKACPLGADKILLLNKILEDGTKDAARKIGYKVLEACYSIDRVILGAVQEEEPVKEIVLR
ncbi:hypothetical protein acsn021_14140 [Anaerocolumna cellulosilytica]|uniref:Uncharacterized protein n=1 Tax=Anaerocolumna cellulosilytica TaxID=433286 RepID=A0A6S6R2U3_9FIRM|nr:selenium cofactor biosynthesis protein YqeC [Anaerocolumna cellulosilytica]MBB5195601.1 putative selenium-dependent hydroxylase accessory protein YqeC [Anaerocolumna cellulosilytica]BCJ93845.1 hypothetical protein acsn021_14140 [Anaerocolumna cellulosilytica]